MTTVEEPTTGTYQGEETWSRDMDHSHPTLVPVDRYISPEWAEREHELMWPKVWQVACSVDHVAEPGDFFEYRCGWLSILVVRGDDGELRAFQNACRHRGNTICTGTGKGLEELRCPYHRWAWTTEGTLSEVPSRKWFGQLDNDEFALLPARVETFGRVVFVNLDMEAMSLHEWLEGIPDDLASTPMDDYRCTSLVTSPMPSNWKVVAEGFSETYHIQGIHREMLGHIDDIDTPQRIWHRHGVSYQNYGVPSPRLGRDYPPEKVWETWMYCQGQRMGLGQDAPMPELEPGQTAQDVIAQAMVDHYAGQGVDLSGYTSAEITGLWQYNLFPNATMLVMPDMVSVLSSRPGPTPDECTFVMMSFRRAAPDAPPSEPITADVPPDTDLGVVMSQDVGIMKTAQVGLHQPGLKHLALAAEECRAINLHRNLDEWVGDGAG